MKVSIIVPAYNVEHYITTTIESLLRQIDAPDFEIILVDDGSTDRTSVLCDEFKKQDSRIVVIHKDNGGLSSARNVGIAVSTGEYLLFVDGDDCLDSSTLSSLTKAANDNPECDIIQFRYEEVNPAAPFGHKVNRELIDFMVISEEQEFFIQLYKLGGVAASVCTKLIKKSILANLRFKEGIIHEDELFTTHLLSRCSKIGYCANEFYKYAIREGSIQHSEFSKKRLDAILVREDRIAYLRSKNYDRALRLFENQLKFSLHLLWREAYTAGDLDSCEWLENRIKKYSGHGSHFGLLASYKIHNILRAIVQKIRNAKTKYSEFKLHKKRQNAINHKRFSIISNNCWGGLVYQYFGLPYTTPTVGLFIMDDDYIRFLERLDHYLKQPLIFIPFEQSRYKDKLIKESTYKPNYPIGLLDDVEIHFLHYHSEEDARAKWEKRLPRINKDQLLVKFSQRSDNSIELLDRFESLPFKNKICFTAYERPSAIFVTVPELHLLNIQGGDETPFVLDKVDLIELINRMS